MNTKNILSLSGETVKFSSLSKKFLVFDILHTEDLRIKKYLFLNQEYSISEIESEIFEWSDGSLLGLYHLSNHFESEITIEVNQIKYFIPTENLTTEKVFGTDSAVICLIDYNQLSVFLDIFDYEDFVECLSTSESRVNEYIRNIEQSISTSFAIISTPGLGKGYEFDGSGRYIIENSSFE